MNTKAQTSADFDKAMDSIRDEMAANARDSAVQMIGNVVATLLQSHPELADKLSAKGKSLKKAMEAMRAEAQKNKSGNWGCVDGMTGMKIVLKHYGIEGITERELFDALAETFAGDDAHTPAPERDEFDIDALLEEV